MINCMHPSRILDQITTATDKRFELVACIADAIVETTMEVGYCAQVTLIDKGFTHQDVAYLWHFACALADVELKCSKNGICSPFEKGVRYA
ncbi:MAG: hypothetical protein PHW63_00495 [Alphaproteobacteria bacterium]|nr:hypothetical protein [Alphaproteobacteria bacterium]